MRDEGQRSDDGRQTADKKAGSLELGVGWVEHSKKMNVQHRMKKTKILKGLKAGSLEARSRA
jgi:hypothetical protein